MISGAGGAEISVIVTTYNHARYLRDAIESIRGQSHPADEIIVVDDGSSDHPETVTAEFTGVELIRQANQGLSAARNTGLRAARGRYILFLDADDRLTEIALDTLLRRIKAHPGCGFVYGAYRQFGTEPDWSKEYTLRPTGRDPYQTLLTQNCIRMHGTVLYRRELLAAIGGFDTTLPACEDYDVYLRMAQKHGVSCGPEVLAEYRQHGSNMSSDLARMNKAVHLVLNKQKAIADTNQHWKAARQRGLRYWFDYYGTAQLGRLKAAVRSGRQVGRSLSQTASFMLPFPGPAIRLIGSDLQRLMRRRAKGDGPAARGPFSGLGTERVSTEFGYDRGKPLDRHYVEDFLARHAQLIHGHVLEIGDTAYTVQFGGDRVVSAEAFHRFAGQPGVTYVGDISGVHNLPDNTFDCMVLTQTLHLIFDMPAAIATIWKALKPGGSVLVTVPWISSIDKGEWNATWYWAISPAGLRKLLETRFAASDIAVNAYGNVLAASAFLYGYAEHEVRPQDLDVDDPLCPVIVAASARKAL
ncbi:glycosyltransferase [Devosia sp. ZW T5_3]|uniref:glycosyltransferase n=1 Tax=Devosia sp. ZW T5_3 TaxID=3378085 RepID=UPI003852E669